MSSKRLGYIAIGICVLLSATTMAVRLHHQRIRRPARGETLWRLHYQLAIHDVQRGDKVRIALPENTAECRVIRETWSYPGFSVDVLRNRDTGGREAVAAAIIPAEARQIAATFDIYMSPRLLEGSQPAKPKLPVLSRARYLREEKLVQVSSPVVDRALKEFSATRRSKSELVQSIADYCFEHIGQDERASYSDAATTLQRKTGTTVGRARAMVALCRAAKMPARLVAGFVLANRTDVRPHVWVQVFTKYGWVPFDPENGYARELPPNYVPARLDGSAVARGLEARVISDYRVRRLVPPQALSRNDHLSDLADLTRLPVGMQRTMALLLLLPAGALVTAVARNLVGLRTFGTFTPSLIALSFVYSDWRSGLLLFILVLGVGLLGRRLLEPLKLLTVPRLGLILTLVVLCIAAALSLMDYYGLTPSARAVLLPIVILTMMIERWHITAQEDGLRVALRRLSGTVAVAAVCYTLLRWEELGRLALRFPEGQVLIAAGLIGIGQYTGYRLSELWRFRDLAGERRQ